MSKIVVRPAWLVSNEAGEELDQQLFPVLQAIHDAGKLTVAAAKAGLSYRHAWNLIGRWSEFFGSPLVNLERGRGTTLTPLGEKLLWAEQRINARLAPQLESLASELNLEISKLVTTARSTLRIHASHGFAVAKLPELLRAHSQIQLDLRYLGTQESLASVARLACLPVAKERYFLICRAESLDLPESKELIELIRGQAFLDLIAGLPGYSAPRAGQVESVAEAFPSIDNRK